MTHFFRFTHRKIIAAVLVALFLLLLVASCQPRYQPAYGVPTVQQGYPTGGYPQVVQGAPMAPAPVIVNNGGGHGGSHFGETLMGSMAGSVAGTMLGNALSNRNVPVQHPTYTTTAPAQRYVPSYSPSYSQRPQPTFASRSTSSRGITTTSRSFGGRTSIRVGRR